jgi:thiamine-phosphate pyrophosphorylase
MATEEDGCRLYLVTPPHLVPATFAPLLAEALDAGDVGAVQLRLKDISDSDLKRAIDVLRPVAQSRGVAFLMNDRPDLAVQHGCDGAPVGQEDTPAAIARKILGELTLGVTCHNSRDLGFAAGEDGADYVAFGAFFPSPTKQGGTVLADVETLEWWAEIAQLPCVAIGGITAENCAPLVRAGADFLAVVSAVWSHPQGPAAGVRAMNAAIAAAQHG